MNSENTFSSIHAEIVAEANRLRTTPKSVSAFEMPILYTDLTKVDDSELVQELFFRILGRKPDEKEYKRYAKALNSKSMSKELLIQTIALSSEAIARGTRVYAIKAKSVDANLLLSLDGVQFIEKSYMWLLGREPEDAAIKDNLERLDHGVDKKKILLEISGSIECMNRGVALIGIAEDNAKAFKESIVIKIRRKIRGFLRRIKRVVKRVLKLN
ncbi:protein of unknown function [Butyrivibrio proteoclasticus]|uniref:DUF4214 domain-containing protein n=2 Tax=Butyrivibrio proteoclasticus TaxID=43305 RepID=A0A1I5PUE3_9FIRM|nr:protein of unknown function [Butyrivibrio proteoclasticus]